MRFAVVSLGCPKNLTDTENISASLITAGYEFVPESSGPEIIILNTCGFIQPAVEESQTEIERLIDLKKNGRIKKLIVAGCLVQRLKKEFAAKYPEVDAFVGVAGQENIVQIIEQGKKHIEVLPRNYQTNMPKLQLTLPHTAYVKIADGCDHNCTFCTIPQIRGAYRSRRIDDIIEEVNYLAEKGVKEISLIGQDTTSYGLDLYGTYKLVDLIKQLARINGLNWIRIMYAYPETVSEDLIELIAGEDKICKYLDMPIQHISDRILKMMRRKVDSTAIRNVIEKLKNSIPDIALRTSVIAGFPGETAAEFNELLKFLKEVEFSKLGVFAYWQEKGTQAASLSNQLNQSTKDFRVQKLLAAQSAVTDRLNKRIKGQIMSVICDSKNYARTQYQAPDIDGGVRVNSLLPAGDFAKVKITAARGYDLEGELLT